MSKLFHELIRGMHYDDASNNSPLVDPKHGASAHLADLAEAFAEAEAEEDAREQEAQRLAQERRTLQERVARFMEELTDPLISLPEYDAPKSRQIAEFLAKDLGIQDPAQARDAMDVLYQEGAMMSPGLKTTPIDMVWQAVTKKLFQKAQR